MIIVFSICRLDTNTFKNNIIQHFEGYMEGRDQLKKNSNNDSFHACPGLKGPLSPGGLIKRLATLHDTDVDHENISICTTMLVLRHCN